MLTAVCVVGTRYRGKLEDGTYTEFTIIKSRYEGKDLTTVQELQESQRTIARGAIRDNLQAQINLASCRDCTGGSTTSVVP